MVTLNRNLFQTFYCRSLSENFMTALLVTQKMVDSKMQEIQIIISLSVILHYVHYCHPNLKKIIKIKFHVSVVYLPKVYIHHYYHGVIGILKNSMIKSKILKIESLVKKKITYMKHIKIWSCHLGVIFMPKHLICKRKNVCVSTVISCITKQ